MFPGMGTTLNIITIIIGGSLGVFIGAKISQKLRDLILDALGCVTIISAADALLDFWDPNFQNSMPRGWALLVVVFSLIFGAVLGSFWRIEERLELFGNRLKVRFSKGDNHNFVEGFVTSSLIFVIGPLAILGSISDGMGTGIDQLVLKSTLDGFAALAFAASLGWGVVLSSIPVGVYQFAWTAIGLLLGAILADYQVLAMTSVGGILLIGISLKLLRIKTIEIGNLLPALALAPLLALLAHQFI
ncbi:MAG: hypothetical protein RLZZ147_449 [Actinomycetota bacterium]|jgi:uncharacterized membrane protein YqgA involved in biofilm formation